MNRAAAAAVASAAAVLAVAGPATADETNRNLFPIGEAESMRANAGIAGSSPGSVFHNPAGLAKIEHPELAVSGTTLMYFRSYTARLFQLDEPVPYKASGFAPIPASLVSTYRVGNFGLATAILVPDLFQLDNRQRHDTPNARFELLQSVRRQDLWIGGSIARKLGDKAAVGLSLFGVRRQSISNSFFLLSLPSQPGVFSQATTSETVSIIGATAVIGATVDVAPWLTIGARIEPPFLQLSGSASIYQAQVSSDGTTTTTSETDDDDVSINQPVPADFGLGFAFKPSPKVGIYLDICLQLPKKYVFVDDPVTGPSPEVELEAAPRGSLGIDVQVSEKIALHAGGMFNRAARRKLETDGDSREDYFGGTLGLSWSSKRTRTGLGMFFLRSNARLVPVFAPGETQSATTTVFAGLLTVAYML